MKIILLSLGIAAATTAIVINATPMTARTKPSTSELAASETSFRLAQGEMSRRLKVNWTPVAAAISAGDVAKARSAFETFLHAEPNANPAEYFGKRSEMAKFYMAHGDLQDAKDQLDFLLTPHTFDYEISPGRRARSYDFGSSDPDTILLWLQVAKDAPFSEKTAMLQTWANNYRTHHLAPGALPNMGPEATAEWAAGQLRYGSQNVAERREAVEHFRRATLLAPNSLDAAEKLAYALRSTSDIEGAKMAAIRASRLIDDPGKRSAYLYCFGVTKEIKP
ncbi:MAG TPA: hypothetical protein VHE55_15070 [Fimbriimonadaceae bacterium]|nr:hypothetical protein [Fimbriimonadaceae bacterium]